jgi:hypothetical protein
MIIAFLWSGDRIGRATRNGGMQGSSPRPDSCVRPAGNQALFRLPSMPDRDDRREDSARRQALRRDRDPRAHVRRQDDVNLVAAWKREGICFLGYSDRVAEPAFEIAACRASDFFRPRPQVRPICQVCAVRARRQQRKPRDLLCRLSRASRTGRPRMSYIEYRLRLDARSISPQEFGCRTVKGSFEPLSWRQWHVATRHCPVR